MGINNASKMRESKMERTSRFKMEERMMEMGEKGGGEYCSMEFLQLLMLHVIILLVQRLLVVFLQLLVVSI